MSSNHMADHERGRGNKKGDHLIPVWLIPGLNHQMYHVPIIIHPCLLQLTMKFMSNKKITTLGSP